MSATRASSIGAANQIGFRRRRSSLKLFYWACASILWTYMSLTISNLYKSWYIATAGVLLLTFLLLLSGDLQSRGVVRSTGLIALYFLYLFFTATWAEYPAITILY